MRETTAVIFRVDLRPKGSGEVVAVFPEQVDRAGDMNCYAHAGQHSQCSMGWYRRYSRPAKPEEYASLKSELEHYGPPDANYTLDIRWRMSRLSL